MADSIREELKKVRKMAGNPNLLGLDDTSDPDPDAYDKFDVNEQSPSQDVGAVDTVPEMGDKPKLTKDSSGGKVKMDQKAKEAALLKKADVCIKVASMMIPNGNDEAVQNMSVDLMHIPNPQLKNIATRLVLSRKGYKLASQMLATKKAEEQKKVAVEEEELDAMASILKEADETEENTPAGEEAVESGEGEIEVKDETPAAEEAPASELDEVEKLLEVEAGAGCPKESAEKPATLTKKDPAGKQAAQKIERTKQASRAPASEDELLQASLTDPDEDIDTTGLFSR